MEESSKRAALAGCSLLAVTLVLFAPVANGQSESISYPAGINFPFIFDDFHYVEEVESDYSVNDWKSGGGQSWRGSVDYSVFGRNKWFEGNGPGTLTLGDLKRGWFIGNWAEHGGWGTDYSSSYHSSSDESWFDGAGYEVSTTLSPLSSKIDDLDNSLTYSEGGTTYDYTPEFLVLRAKAGQYEYPTGGISMQLGHTARVGTWVTHLMLPDTSGIDNDDAQMKVGPWTQGLEQYYMPGDSAVIYGQPYPWSEVNWEWFSYEEPSNGVVWGNYWTNLGGQSTHGAANPVFGAASSQGKCWLKKDGPGYATEHLDVPDCMDFVSGRSGGGYEKKFVTVVIRVTETSTETYLIGWDFDLALNRPGQYETGFYDDFDIAIMQNQETVTNYVPPRHMHAKIDFFIGNQDSANYLYLYDEKEVVVDWFLYSPDTAFSVYDIPAYVQNIRKKLIAYNDGKSGSDQVWRINSTGRSTQGPWTYEQNWNNGSLGSCDRNDGVRSLKWDKDFDFDVKTQTTTGGTFLYAETVVDGSHDYRHERLRTTWDIYSTSSMALVATEDEVGTAIEVDTGWPSSFLARTELVRYWDVNSACGSTAQDPQPEPKWYYYDGTGVTETALTMSISGPSSLGWKEDATLTATHNWTYGSPTYQWWFRPNGIGAWQSQSGSGATQDIEMVWTGGVEFKVEVTVGPETREDTHWISYGAGGGAKRHGEEVLTYELAEPFPNPSSGKVTFDYSQPEEGYVVLEVFDTAGRVVETLVDNWMAAGRHSESLSRPLGSGVYFVRLTVNGHSFDRQFVRIGE